MTREQAVNYLISSGFSEEQVSEVVRALTYEPTTKNYLSEEDILELKHRYGDEVEFVVRDMLTGEGKRWDKLPSIEPTTKHNSGVDCISRAQTQTEIEMHACRYTIAKERGGMGHVEWSDQLIKVSDAVDIIRHLPSVTPQEPCDKCEVGNPCLYCKHEFEPQESEE